MREQLANYYYLANFSPRNSHMAAARCALLCRRKKICDCATGTIQSALFSKNSFQSQTVNHDYYLNILEHVWRYHHPRIDPNIDNWNASIFAK